MIHEPVRYPFLKWLTDKVISFVLIVLLFPALGIVIVVMSLNMLLCRRDRGTFLYRERRISRGREFDILKFRTLQAAIIAEMPEDDRHARIHEDNANNLTWSGRHLLKPWYWDELPQLFNILRGEMSLVGPRPWPVSLVDEQIGRGVTYRNSIRAGWTGPAQLQKSKRSTYGPTSENSEQLDLEYVQNCNAWPSWRLWIYDLKVLANTLWVMVESQGLKN